MSTGQLAAFVKGETVGHPPPKMSDSWPDKRAQSQVNPKRWNAAMNAYVKTPRTVLGDQKSVRTDSRPLTGNERASTTHRTHSESAVHEGSTGMRQPKQTRGAFDTDVDSIGDTTTMSMSQPAGPAEAEKTAPDRATGEPQSPELQVSTFRKNNGHYVRMAENEHPSNDYVEAKTEDYEGEASEEEAGGHSLNSSPKNLSRQLETVVRPEGLQEYRKYLRKKEREELLSESEPGNSLRNLSGYLLPGEEEEYQRFIEQRETEGIERNLETWPGDLPSRKAAETGNDLHRGYFPTNTTDVVQERRRDSSDTRGQLKEPSNQERGNLWTNTSTQSGRGLPKQNLERQVKSIPLARERASPGISSNIWNSAENDGAQMSQTTENVGASTFAGSKISSEALNSTSKGRYKTSIDASEDDLKRGVELDYSHEQLSKMPYSDLQNQSFDQDPSASSNILPERFKISSLAEKLEHIRKPSNTSPPDSEQHFEAQCRFFSSLTIEQYEECGDLIIDQFTDIMKRFKEVRQDKRKVAAEFETEVSQRQATVMKRTGFLEKDMGRLRRAGQDVVRGGNG